MKNPPTPESLFYYKVKVFFATDSVRLLEILKDSSDKNRDFLIAYLLLLIYVLATVFSTTDIQLLVVTETFKLPIIDLTVPVEGFYLMAPVFVLALHFNLLQNLESHYFKLMKWRKYHYGRVPKESIRAFIFDFAALEDGSYFEAQVRLVNSFLCFYFAPLTLGILLWRYTDRQNGLMTIIQCSVFIIDLFLVNKLRTSLRKYDSGITTWPRPLVITCLWNIFVGTIIAEVFITICVSWLPSKLFTNYLLSPMLRVSDLPTTISSPLLPRIVILPTQRIWELKKEIWEAEADLFWNDAEWAPYFKSDGLGFIPATKNLRLIELPWQRLPNAKFENAYLEGANLESSRFLNAKLKGAKLSGANLYNAEFQEADLSTSHLEGANLRKIRLVGSNLTGTFLEGSNLSYAQMQGATLVRTRLMGANLVSAHLEGAFLSSTHLEAIEFDNGNSPVLTGAGLFNVNPETLPGIIKQPCFKAGQEVSQAFSCEDLKIIGTTVPNRRYIPSEDWISLDYNPRSHFFGLVNQLSCPSRGNKEQSCNISNNLSEIVDYFCSEEIKNTERKIAAIKGTIHNIRQMPDDKAKELIEKFNTAICKNPGCNNSLEKIDEIKCIRQ